VNRKIIITGDGSHSVTIPERNISYHSKYGAIQESVHIFIEAGLKPALHVYPLLHVFEMGFGTGLNTLLTLIQAEQENQLVAYQAIDNCPLEKSMTSKINFCSRLDRPDLQSVFELLHDCEWEKDIPISNWFRFRKCKQDFIDHLPRQTYHLIFFDPFDPAAQPELWEKKIFEKLFAMLRTAGALLTYSSSGRVRRSLEEAGFAVQKLPGPPHKREIIRAVKK
jgi:tRNA U34 5-methylaminomethyl-2-thiouridine-forming methyltransferase MnmC